MLGDLPEHEDEWLGFRPTLPDFLPVIGPSKNYKNVYYCFCLLYTSPSPRDRG